MLLMYASEIYYFWVCMFLQTMLCRFPLVRVFVLCLLQLWGNEPHMEQILLWCWQVKAAIFVVCSRLGKTRDSMIPHDINAVVVLYLSIDLKSIIILQKFLPSLCLLEMINHVTYSLLLVVGAILFHDSLLNLFQSMVSNPARFPLL